MQNYKKLDAWAKAHALLINLHRELRHFPRQYASLCGQLRRAAESIPTNIVEGCGFTSQRQFAKYLESSISSANEVGYHLRVAHDYGILPRRQWESMTADTIEVRKTTFGLLKRVREAIAREEAQEKLSSRRRRADADELSAGSSSDN